MSNELSTETTMVPGLLGKKEKRYVYEYLIDWYRDGDWCRLATKFPPLRKNGVFIAEDAANHFHYQRGGWDCWDGDDRVIAVRTTNGDDMGTYRVEHETRPHFYGEECSDEELKSFRSAMKVLQEK